MSGLRSELHVAQQIRRDKLRIQSSSQHLQQEFHNNIEPLSLHQGPPGFNSNNLDLDEEDSAAALYPSEMMISFATTPSNSIPAPPRNTLECQEPSSSRLMMPLPHYGSFPHSLSSLHSSPKQQQHLGNWRNSSGPHPFSDWMLNYSTSITTPTTTTSSVANSESNPNSFLAFELHNNNINNVATTHTHQQDYVKPSCNLLTDLQSSPPSCTTSAHAQMATRDVLQKQLGEMHYPSSSSSPRLYHNALQDIFKSTPPSTSGHGSEIAASLMHHGIWGGGNNSNFPVFHGNQANVWTNRTQGLSLSLSSNSQQSKPSGSHFEEGSASASDGVGPQYSKPVNMKSIMKPLDPVQIVTTTTTTPSSNTSSYRHVGPLGPFTGYATILKSSRFLKPCQQLLDECCCNQKVDVDAEWVSRDHHVSAADVAAKGNTNNSGGCSSSSTLLYTSKENSADGGGAAGNFCLSSRPECQKNKAKLLYMQEEVTRRYKQYHQQMQLVVSSFELVAGLSCATPYISMALKSVSRHFRCLKNAISDQLKLTYEVLGEDFSIPTTSTSSCKIDNSNIATKLRRMDHSSSFQKNKSGGSNNMDFPEPQQHVWRPQRGLPERSVAVLKAWLFEHFLHPYPTDTDKHMLATQTGLSRNQVSNWFINARVRVWKPMVEEIHTLETKGATEAYQNSSSKNEGAASASEGVDQHVNKFGSTHATIAERQFQCLEMGSSSGNVGNEEQWNQEKRSKLECDQVTPNMMDGTDTVMGFMPYRRGGGGGGLDHVGGLGSVSLTLGLRHGIEGVQHQQQLQQEVELRRQFGGHMIHDFVG